ncbi:MAG: hypothetical protein EZS26_000748 [Candidatus Ordinivivax streblomastigis]|uniref:Uncharacterized protein n=1 Tax=Candidatus Ordinivivax streblomastigis TaxID=2540710 RepID=A0A5M8P3T5_9BACT|nr:MAG: hypothetical protein EZS26_000748 [Candidatus Ordinivivax streblomastigis]
MIVAIIILSVLLTLSVIFSGFCYMHYHLQRKDFEAYQRIAESNEKLHESQYDYLCDLLNELKSIIKH